MSSPFVTNSPARSASVVRSATAPLPRRTGTSPSSNKCWAGRSWNGPNETTPSVEGPDGSPTSTPLEYQYSQYLLGFFIGSGGLPVYSRYCTARSACHGLSCWSEL